MADEALVFVRRGTDVLVVPQEETGLHSREEAERLLRWPEPRALLEAVCAS